jgi:general secretion pathway protein D
MVMAPGWGTANEPPSPQRTRPTGNDDDKPDKAKPAPRLLRSSLKDKGKTGAQGKATATPRGGKKAGQGKDGQAGGGASGNAGGGQKNQGGSSTGVGSGEGGGPWTGVKDADKMGLGIEYKKPKRGTRFSFNLVDAELIELIKIIGNITGKSFILGGKVPNVKATIYAPTKITATEAYHAFLSVLQVNGLTIVPAGRYLKIQAVGGATSQNTPIMSKGAIPGRDQFITRLHQLEHVSSEEIAALLDRFKSPDGDITVYTPTNMLIITDYGTSIRRLVKLIKLLDVPGIGEKIWIEPVNYASAQELADRIIEIFDISAGTTSKAKREPAKKATKRSKKKRAKAKTSKAGVSVYGAQTDGMKVSKILADERTNSLIIVASETSYLRILELVKILDVPIAGEGTIHVHKLQHADAEEISKTLNNLSRKGGRSTAGKKGKAGKSGGEAASLFEGDMQISADQATNSLVIVSSLRDYISLKAVIDALDTMQRQVFVEAVIMEVSLDKNRDLGIGIHGGNIIGSGDDQSLVYGSSQPGQDSNSFTQVFSVPMLSGLAAGLSGPELEGSEDLIGMSIPAFGVALHALQTNSDVNVLSTPNILATDNVEATIQVGENVPVQQGFSGSSMLSGLAGRAGADSGTSNLGALGGMLGGYGGMMGGMMGGIGRQNVGITLKVTPQINDDNQVRLEIDLEISEVKSIDPVTGPTISQQSATTTSVVADQQTIVIGGLITDNQVETTTKVPVLGDIPILGMLFRRKSSLTKKRNLLIFLTPYIIRTSEDFKEIFARKMAERREFIERYTAFEYHRYDPHLDWSRTNGAIAVMNRILAQEEEDERLRLMTAVEEDDDHSPKKPIELPSGTRLGGDGRSTVISNEPRSTVGRPVLGTPLMMPSESGEDR